MIPIYIVLFFLLLMGFKNYSVKWIMHFAFYAIIVIVFASIILNVEAIALPKLLYSGFLENWLEGILKVLAIISENAHYIYITFAIIISVYLFWKMLKIFLSILFAVIVGGVVLEFFFSISVLTILGSLSNGSYYYILAALFIISMIFKKDLVRNIILFGLLLIFVGLSSFSPSFLQFKIDDEENYINQNIIPIISVSQPKTSNILLTKNNKEYISPFVHSFSSYKK